MSGDVPKRVYRSPLRRQRAEETRRRVIEAAAAEMSARGWDGTTIARIAHAAGVSTDRVATIGSKSFLLLEGFRIRALGEEGGGDVRERDFARDVFAIQDPAEALDAVVAVFARIHAASATLWLLIRSTARTEPEVAAVLAELKASRDQSCDVTIDWLLGLGAVAPAPGATLEDYRFGAHLSLSAEHYVQVTSDWAASADDYRAWLRLALCPAA